MPAATSELSPDQLRNALAALDQAIYHHEQWLEGIHTTIVCRLPPDARDIDAEAYCKCRFGQWYYGPGSAMLAANSGFVAIEQEHRRMHELGGSVLRAMARGESPLLRDYNNFTHAAKRMRLEISTLKAELEATLFNLDPLTGAGNRIAMLTKLREQQEFVRRNVMSCGIAMIDLDYFKTVNDSYGHLVGDRVLVACTRYMLDHTRAYDKIYRYGGEEFLLCVPNADLEVARNFAERLREGIAALPFDGDDGEPFHITVSFGLTLLAPDVPVEQSIDRADKALYEAKQTGRNRVVVWDPSMT